jgi:hypothetical protein
MLAWDPRRVLQFKTSSSRPWALGNPLPADYGLDPQQPVPPMRALHSRKNLGTRSGDPLTPNCQISQMQEEMSKGTVFSMLLALLIAPAAADEPVTARRMESK